MTVYIVHSSASFTCQCFIISSTVFILLVAPSGFAALDLNEVAVGIFYLIFPYHLGKTTSVEDDWFFFPDG